MAIACLRLFTLRPEPLFNVPFFFRCIADLTRLLAALPYLAMSSVNANTVLSRRLVPLMRSSTLAEIDETTSAILRFGNERIAAFVTSFNARTSRRIASLACQY